MAKGQRQDRAGGLLGGKLTARGGLTNDHRLHRTCRHRVTKPPGFDSQQMHGEHTELNRTFPQGGPRLWRGLRSRTRRPSHGDGLPTPLRSHEILTLLLTGDLLEPIAATTLGAAHTALRDRLMAGLTPEARGFVKEQRAALKATHGAPAQLCVAPDVLSEIEEASEREHCLRLDYATPGKTPMARVVEPHLFWVHAGRPYLVAYCRSAGELRTFALQRVTGAQMLDEPFERRADFDAQSFVEQGFGVLHGARHAFAVRFGPRGKPSAPSALAAVRRR